MLDDVISEPSEELTGLCAGWKGMTAILGIGGKMGLHMGMMLAKAGERSGSSSDITGISRFSDPAAREKIETRGVRTISADLMDPDAVAGLPDADRIVYMVGRKFGTDGSEWLTWAVNTLIPEAVCRRYAGTPIVAYSTGAVYDRVPVNSGGAKESSPLTPLGEYANSAVGRERIFDYMSEKTGTPVCLVRLFYSIDLRYGVLRDIGDKVAADGPIDLNMGYVNVIWQGDAINQSLLAFPHCSVPPRPLNITGPEIVSIQYVAEKFGEMLGRKPRFTGEPANDALLGDSGAAVELFGPPEVSLDRMIIWIAEWIRAGGRSLNKPAHYEVRNGKY